MYYTMDRLIITIPSLLVLLERDNLFFGEFNSWDVITIFPVENIITRLVNTRVMGRKDWYYVHLPKLLIERQKEQMLLLI